MFIDIDGLRINYIVSGKGKPVVLMHGWGCSTKTFESVHKHLENYFCTYSIDFPGFGESEEPKEPWGVKEYSEFFCKFLERLDIHNPIVIGHSFGGRIIIRSSAMTQYNKVILTGCAGIKPKRKLSYYIKVYSYKLMKKLALIPGLRNYFGKVVNNYKNKVGSADYKNASDMMKKVLIKVVNEDLREYLPNIKAPTLLIWGEKDTYTPLADGKLMEKFIPDAGLVVFKNCSHYAYLQKLGDFLVIIDNFLKKDMEETNG